MTKRIVLSLLLCAMVMGVGFPATSFALTDEQKQIGARIAMLDKMFQQKRADVREIMKPESATQDKSTYMYDQGLSKVCFDTKTSEAYYIEASMPATHNLTMPLMQEAIKGIGYILPTPNQFFVMKDGYHIIITFGEDQKCKQIQFVKDTLILK